MRSLFLTRFIFIAACLLTAFSAQAEEAVAAKATIYKLSPLDTLVISVYGQEDLSSEQRISDQGAISMPLLGDVTLGGLSVHEAQKLLERSFVEQRYLVKPVVTISIKEFSPKIVTVLGEVGKPGSIEIPSGRNGIPIQIAIAQAGGFTGAAHKGEVKVRRSQTEGEEEQAFTVDVATILDNSGRSKSNQLFLVLPDDIVFVPRRLF